MNIKFKKEAGLGNGFVGNVVINDQPVAFYVEWFHCEGEGWEHSILSENPKTHKQCDGLQGCSFTSKCVKEELMSIGIKSSDRINTDIADQLISHAKSTYPSISAHEGCYGG